MVKIQEQQLTRVSVERHTRQIAWLGQSQKRTETSSVIIGPLPIHPSPSILLRPPRAVLVRAQALDLDGPCSGPHPSFYQLLTLKPLSHPSPPLGCPHGQLGRFKKVQHTANIHLLLLLSPQISLSLTSVFWILS